MSDEISYPTGMSAKLQLLGPCLPNPAISSDTDVAMDSIQPKSHCGRHYMLRDDHGQQNRPKGVPGLWFDGNLVFDFSVMCEERLAREATIYEHLGKHPRILTCFGLEEVHHGIHSLRLDITFREVDGCWISPPSIR